MFLKKLNLIPFFHPDDNIEPVNKGDEELDKNEVIDLLGADDKVSDEDKPLKLEEEKPKKPEKKEKVEDEDDEGKEDKADEDDEDEDDDLKELEEELKGVSEEKLELMTPVRRKEILAKYPKLFKEFPYLERAYYREQEFTQLFSTIADAKEVAAKADTLDKYENDLLEGNTENVLKIIKEHDKNTFNRVVDGYLDKLRTVDENAYFHVLGGVIKKTIVTMVEEAQSTGNDALKNAAALLNQFVFGSSKFTPHTNLATQDKPEDNTKEKELKAREQNIVRQNFERTRDDLNTRIDNVLKATIDGNIDPKNSMSDFVKRHATREALETLNEHLNRDTRFRGIIDKLWEEAFKNNFSKDSTDKIKRAYLSRAQTVLPSVIKKARNEALKGLNRKQKETDSEELESVDKKGPVPPGRSTTPSNRGKSSSDNKKETVPEGMRTIDYLMQD